MEAFVLRQTKQPLELESRPDLKPGPGEVVVQLVAASLNRRDYWITQGLYPGIEPPVILGSDGAGKVVRVGDDVDPNCIGQSVVINPGLNWGDFQLAQANDFHILGLPSDGTFATEVCVPFTAIDEQPDHLTPIEAAALPLAGVTAFRALFAQGRLQAGENVLVSGIGGGVATFALQFAIAAGANVWVTSSSSEKIERAVSLGAKGGFNYKEEGWSKACRKQAGSIELVIDGAGGKGYNSLLDLVAPGGRIVNYGATAGPPEKLDMFKVFWKQLTIQGSTMGSPVDFTRMLQFVEQSKVKPVVDRVMPWSQVNEAIELMGTSPQFGKMVIEIDPQS